MKRFFVEALKDCFFFYSELFPRIHLPNLKKRLVYRSMTAFFLVVAGLFFSRWGSCFVPRSHSLSPAVHSSLLKQDTRPACRHDGALQCTSGEVTTEAEGFARSFVTQKNYILLEKLQNPEGMNLTAAAFSFVNFCDESFNIFLNDRIANAENEEAKQALGRIRYEINRARQTKLMNADKILRDVLSAGGLKQMEAKLGYYLRRSEIDMAFTVILRLNMEDAIRANVTTAVQIMTHLETLINEHQDALVSPPVKLMRLLVRTEDSNVRRQMLRQKLIFPSDEEVLSVAGGKAEEAAPTPSPQCEHIVVEAVRSWGGKDVRPVELEDTIADVRAQVL